MSATACDVAEAMTRLTDPAMPIPASAFDKEVTGYESPGLYSWWADEYALRVTGEVLGEQVGPLIYVGQAGATRWPSGKRSNATLGSRIAGQHIGGNTGSSTFRLTVSAILFGPHGLSVEKPGRLIRGDGVQVTDWICSHLSVALCPFPERDRLRDIETGVLDAIDPPLNLRGMAATPVRDQLTQMRRLITKPDASDQPPFSARGGVVMGSVEMAVRGNLSSGQVLHTPSQRKPFKIGRIDAAGLEILMGRGEWPVRLTWDCLEGIPGYLETEGRIPIGGRHSSVPHEGTLDGYLKLCTRVTTAGWVASVLESVGVLRIVSGRPALVELAR